MQARCHAARARRRWRSTGRRSGGIRRGRLQRPGLQATRPRPPALDADATPSRLRAHRRASPAIGSTDRTQSVPCSTCLARRLIRGRSGKGISDVGQLVFRRPTRTGFQPWRPDVTTHLFQRPSAEAGVPIVPFHYRRHSCASWLLGAGLDVVAVSERLGQWSPSLTLSVYAHAIRGRRRELAQAIGAAPK